MTLASSRIIFQIIGHFCFAPFESLCQSHFWSLEKWVGSNRSCLTHLDVNFRKSKLKFCSIVSCSQAHVCIVHLVTFFNNCNPLPWWLQPQSRYYITLFHLICLIKFLSLAMLLLYISNANISLKLWSALKYMPNSFLYWPWCTLNVKYSQQNVYTINNLKVG